jgi:hypothetical protein
VNELSTLMSTWLYAPISGATTHELAGLLAWHGRLMVLAWGVLIPVGVLVARYFKIWPGQRWPAQLDHPGWWHSHRACQWSAVCLMTLATALAWQSAQPAASLAGALQLNLPRLHTQLGWGLLCAAWLQIVAGFARGSKGGPTAATMRGDHFDMTPRRRLFEHLHKSLGWASLLVACATMLIGLVLVDAPRWMPLLLLLWWVMLAALSWRWQRQARCIDTYQAIWGPDPSLPGLARSPIGWGVVRRSPNA